MGPTKSKFHYALFSTVWYFESVFDSFFYRLHLCAGAGSSQAVGITN